MSRPICDSTSNMNTYFYCAYNYMCHMTERANARYRKRVDKVYGDVCEDVAVACPC